MPASAGMTRSGKAPEARTAALNDAALSEIGNLGRRQSEPAAVDVGIVLAELRTGGCRHFVSAVKTQWRGRDDNAPDLVVLDPFEHAALVHVRVVHDLADVAHRGARNAKPLGDREHLHLAEGLRPCGYRSVSLVHMRDAVGTSLETRVVSQILAAHRGQQIMPVLFECDVHCDIAVIGRIDIERRARTAAIARYAVERCPSANRLRDAT